VSRNAKCTMNAQQILHVNHPKKTLKGDFATSQGGLFRSTPLKTVRWKNLKRAGQGALKSKLTQGEPSGTGQLRSDGFCDGQAGWASCQC
jgi:hypothetical protein